MSGFQGLRASGLQSVIYSLKLLLLLLLLLLQLLLVDLLRCLSVESMAARASFPMKEVLGFTGPGFRV